MKHFCNPDDLSIPKNVSYGKGQNQITCLEIAKGAVGKFNNYNGNFTNDPRCLAINPYRYIGGWTKMLKCTTKRWFVCKKGKKKLLKIFLSS